MALNITSFPFFLNLNNLDTSNGNYGDEDVLAGSNIYFTLPNEVRRVRKIRMECYLPDGYSSITGTLNETRSGQPWFKCVVYPKSNEVPVFIASNNPMFEVAGRSSEDGTIVTFPPGNVRYTEFVLSNQNPDIDLDHLIRSFVINQFGIAFTKASNVGPIFTVRCCFNVYWEPNC